MPARWTGPGARWTGRSAPGWSCRRRRRPREPALPLPRGRTGLRFCGSFLPPYCGETRACEHGRLLRISVDGAVSSRVRCEAGRLRVGHGGRTSRPVRGATTSWPARGAAGPGAAAPRALACRAAFAGELAGEVRMHLDHLASLVLWAWSLALEVAFLGDVYRLWPGALRSL